MSTNIFKVINSLPLDDKSKSHLLEEYHHIVFYIPTHYFPTPQFKQLLHLIINLQLFSLFTHCESTSAAGVEWEHEMSTLDSTYRIPGDYYGLRIFNTFTESNYLNNIPLTHIVTLINLINDLSNLPAASPSDTKPFLHISNIPSIFEDLVYESANEASQHPDRKYIEPNFYIPTPVEDNTINDASVNRYFSLEETLKVLKHNNYINSEIYLTVYTPYASSKEFLDLVDFMCDLNLLQLVSTDLATYSILIYTTDSTSELAKKRYKLLNLLSSLSNLPPTTYSVTAGEDDSHSTFLFNI